MLPPFIIDQIRQREEDEKRRDNVLQLPLPIPELRQEPRGRDDDPAERGVVVIDLG